MSFRSFFPIFHRPIGTGGNGAAENETPLHPLFRLTRLNFELAILAVLAVFILCILLSVGFGLKGGKGCAVLISIALAALALVLLLLRFLIASLFGLRFQFSLRALLLCAVVAAIPCSWLAVEKEQARRQKEAVEAAKSKGGEVVYDYDTHDGSRNGRARNYIPPNQLFWRKLLGDDFFDDVAEVSFRTEVDLHCLKGLSRLPTLILNVATDEELKSVEGLTNLDRLVMSGTDLTDAGLVHLKGLTNLKHLDLWHTRVTDAGLVHLKGLTNLTYLDLRNTQVTDAGLADLKRLTNLRYLFLSETRVTDAGLLNLYGLENLRGLDLSDTRVTKDAVRKLRLAIPQCTISGPGDVFPVY